MENIFRSRPHQIYEHYFTIAKGLLVLFRLQPFFMLNITLH